MECSGTALLFIGVDSSGSEQRLVAGWFNAVRCYRLSYCKLPEEDSVPQSSMRIRSSAHGNADYILLCRRDSH
jgi:hypothetical protein